MLTRSLKDAVARMEVLPEEKQRAIAATVIAELDSEERWDTLFAGSQDMLSKMADSALEEEARGRTRPLDESLS